MTTYDYVIASPFFYTNRPTRDDELRHWWLSSKPIPLNHAARWIDRPTLKLRCAVCEGIFDCPVREIEHGHPHVVRDHRGAFDHTRIFTRCTQCRNAVTLELSKFALEGYLSEQRVLLILLSMDVKEFCGEDGLDEEKHTLTRLCSSVCFLDRQDYIKGLCEDDQDECENTQTYCEDPKIVRIPPQYA